MQTPFPQAQPGHSYSIEHGWALVAEEGPLRLVSAHSASSPLLNLHVIHQPGNGQAVTGTTRTYHRSRKPGKDEDTTEATAADPGPTWRQARRRLSDNIFCR